MTRVEASARQVSVAARAESPDTEQAMQGLQTLLASRMAEGLRGVVANKSITEIAEEVLHSESLG